MRRTRRLSLDTRSELIAVGPFMSKLISRRLALSSLASFFAFSGVAIGQDSGSPLGNLLELPRAGVDQKTGENAPGAVVSALAFSPDGKLLVSAGDDHIVRIWSLQDSQVVHELKGHTDWVRTVRFSPDGTQVASAGDDRHIRVWDVASGRFVKAFDEHGLSIFNLNYSPDGNTIVAAGFENKLRVYDAATGRVLKTFDCPCRDMRALAFTPDGRRLAGGGRNGRIRIWDMSDGTTETQWQAHAQRIRAMCFSPDGLQLISASEDRTIKVWDLATPGQSNEMFSLKSEGAKVMSLVYCGPDKLATGGSDNLVRIWDLYRRQELTRLAGHTGSIAALVASADGQLLVSGSFDTTIRVWNVERHLNSNPTAQRPFSSEVR